MMRGFKFYLTLAARNLWRQRRRTLLTFLAVSLGLASFITVDSLMKGLDGQSIANLVTLETSEVRLTAPGYLDNKDEEPLSYLLQQDEAVISNLRAQQDIVGVAPRLAFSARAGNGWDEYPQEAVGVNPTLDQTVFEVTDYLIDGRWLNPEGYEAVISKDLANILELGLGEYLLLTTRTKGQSFQAVDLEIVGIINTINPTTNNQIFLPLATAGEVVTAAGSLSQIDLKLASGTSSIEKAEDLEKSLTAGGYKVIAQPWQEVAADFLEISRTKNMFNGMFLAMIFLVAAVGIVNSILLATIERTREIGVLKAMGMTRNEIVRLFLVEAAGIGVIGSLAGVLFALGTEVYLVNVGIDFTSVVGDLDIGYPVTGIITGDWNPGTMLGAFLFGVFVCILSGILPARYGANKEPVEALRRA